ncbi:melatonin receptor type 1B-B-like [Ptychodera flava]|uniref:melatonin receptor type 1B-B-like n=1 Tax=Ptychodera flava TaxID=63121 RepID=UPI00396A5D6C
MKKAKHFLYYLDICHFSTKAFRSTRPNELRSATNGMNSTSKQSFTRPTNDVVVHWPTQLCGTLELLLATGALVGNVMFILIVILKKKLRSWMNVFLVNISVTDIIAALFVSIPTVDSYYHRQWRFGSTYCLIHNLLHPFLLSTSLWLTALVSINRYVYIVRNNIYQRFTNTITVTLAIAFAWITPIVSQYSAYVDRSSSSYDPSAFRCRNLVTPVLLLLLMFTPSFLVLASYILIIAYVIKSRRRVQAHGATQPGSSTPTTGPTPRELRMLAVVFGVFSLVLLGYLPYAFILFVSKVRKQSPPRDSLVLAYPLMHIGGVINPCLYGASNMQFRKAYKELVTGKLIRCWKMGTSDPVVPTTAADLRNSSDSANVRGTNTDNTTEQNI